MPATDRLDLVFMGTPDFSVPALRALVDAGHRIVAVYSQPPRPSGRGHKVRPSPVHAAAEAMDIPVRTPTSLRDEAARAAFADLGADAAVVAAYGLILPRPILEAPRLGCLNIHASLLPRWRGAAPIQRAILAGDQTTGITIMLMDEGLDTGPMLSREALDIGPTATAAWVHDDLARIGADLIVETLADHAAGRVTPEPQPEDGITYAAKLDRSEGRVDWSAQAREIDRQVRALNPWPGVWFERDGERVKLLEAQPVGGRGAPGTVLDDRPAVACGQGALQLLRLQRPGKGPVDGDAFLRGNPLPPGTVLST